MTTTGPNDIKNRCVTADDDTDGSTADDDTDDPKNCIYDICFDVCGDPNSVDENDQPNNPKKDSSECHICRIAESIWGNCETHPTASLQVTGSHNKIKTPTSGQSDTLLSWFAKNTNTQNDSDNCRDTSCGPGFIPTWDANTNSTICISAENVSSDGLMCPITDNYTQTVIFADTADGTAFTNCCSYDNKPGSPMDDTEQAASNCCLGSMTAIKGVDTTTTGSYFGFEGELDDALLFCMPDNKSMPDNKGNHMVAKYKEGNDDIYIVCVGGTSSAIKDTDTPESYPNGDIMDCKGRYVLVNGTSYNTPTYATYKVDPSTVGPYPTQFYRPSNYSEGTDNTCTMNTDGTWPEACGTPAAWLIQYIEEEQQKP